VRKSTGSDLLERPSFTARYLVFGPIVIGQFPSAGADHIQNVYPTWTCPALNRLSGSANFLIEFLKRDTGSVCDFVLLGFVKIGTRESGKGIFADG
jgi:hypothetical protein